MANEVLWRRLTETDFNAMNGTASPYGRGGGARHIALGARTNAFPIDEFLGIPGKTEAIIDTVPYAGFREAGTLSFASNPSRRGGEWLIRDQFHHRHPAWSDAAGFPNTYDKTNCPYILVFRLGNEFHVRFSNEHELAALGPDLPVRILQDSHGVAPVTPSLQSHFGLIGKTLVDLFQKQADEDTSTSFDPKDVEDGRKKVLAEIVRRQGQQAFRRELINAYEGQCAITQVQTPYVLEAAHITPYKGTDTNSVSNGLLLRADIHTLFDLALISIDPNERLVRVSSVLAGSEYVDLERKPLFRPKKVIHRPSAGVLREHYSHFRP